MCRVPSQLDVEGAAEMMNLLLGIVPVVYDRGSSPALTAAVDISTDVTKGTGACTERPDSRRKPGCYQAPTHRTPRVEGRYPMGARSSYIRAVMAE